MCRGKFKKLGTVNCNSKNIYIQLFPSAWICRSSGNTLDVEASGFNFPPGQFLIECFYLGLELTVSSRRPQASQQKLDIFLHFFMYGVFLSVNFPKAFCMASQF
ncbi:hypothetical protein ACB098_10G177400 [Castanea mollissima]